MNKVAYTFQTKLTMHALVGEFSSYIQQISNTSFNFLLILTLFFCISSFFLLFLISSYIIQFLLLTMMSSSCWLVVVCQLHCGGGLLPALTSSLSWWVLRWQRRSEGNFFTSNIDSYSLYGQTICMNHTDYYGLSIRISIYFF